MISAFLRRLPIRHKLVAMIMLTTTSALVLASIGYLVNDYFIARTDLLRDLNAQASVALENSTSAIEFLDHKTAHQTLQTLGTNTHLRAACLYDASGKLFARYTPFQRPAECPASVGSDGHRFTMTSVELTRSIGIKGDLTGSIYLHSDLGTIQQRLGTQVLLVLVLLGLTMAVALLLSARLQNLVSAPVRALSETAAQVSAAGDYSLRAKRLSDDELGVLVDVFNRMLERIELRESELSRANEELRREIAERRRAEQERAELLVREREANRLKDEFLATLSHELRTPLNAILGWTRLLRSSAVPPGGVDRALEKVERNARVQSRLVEDLLEVSRIVSGKLRLEPRPLDLVTLVNAAIDAVRPSAEARSVTVERQFAAAAMPTMGDPDRIQQVVWNLLSNSVKFTPAGGRVTVALAREAGTDRLVVSDTGAGIDPKFLPYVFDTFRQGDASSTRAHGGLGLGLSIVRHLVEMHGGTVTASSDGIDRGATFTVLLPVRSVERPWAPRADDTGDVPRGHVLAGCTVLVVDDDDDTREVLVSVLERAGATAMAAASADEALAIALDRPPDAILSDIAMPVRDGYSLLLQLMTALGHRAPRVRIALSAFAGQADRDRATAAGFQRHMAKPFDPEDVVTAVAEILHGHASLNS